LVIDGGTKESGKALVAHLTTFYGTDTVDAVICSHSDADHASGLTEVIDNLEVKRLLMHLPWKHVGNIDELLKDADMSSNKAAQHFKKSLDNAHELASLAEKKEIPILEPFSDTVKATANFAILGPSTTYYEELLQNFRCSPAAPEKPALLQKSVTAVTDAVKWIAEELHIETLADPKEDDCSAENNSSVILLFTDGQSRFLFSSDAGVPALTRAVARAVELGIDLKTVTGLQIPHHGSKHNVGPTILNSLVGPKVNGQQPRTKTAFVSAAKLGAPKHPSKRVVNAFLRRGAEVYSTTNGSLLHHNGGNARGWGQAIPLPFSPQVEE
jgi:beta-lactamase superfamily II metal-dependent hydrolase